MTSSGKVELCSEKTMLVDYRFQSRVRVGNIQPDPATGIRRNLVNLGMAADTADSMEPTLAPIEMTETKHDPLFIQM